MTTLELIEDLREAVRERVMIEAATTLDPACFTARGVTRTLLLLQLARCRHGLPVFPACVMHAVFTELIPLALR